MIFAVVIAVCCICAPQLVDFMEVKNNDNSTNSTIVEDTIFFIRISSPGLFLGYLVQFTTIVAILKSWNSVLLINLVLKVGLSIAGDYFFVSQNSVMLKSQVNGVALTDFIVNAAIFIFNMVFITIKLRLLNDFSKFDFRWFKQWLLQIGVWTGVQSLVRNLFYIYFYSRLINQIGASAASGTAGQMIWSFLLLPTITYGEVLKRYVVDKIPNEMKIDHSIKIGKETVVKLNLKTIAICNIALICLTFVSVPLWPWFLKNVLKGTITGDNNSLTFAYLSLPFIITFIITNTFGSIWQAFGLTLHYAIVSVFVNVAVYIPFIPSVLGSPSLEEVLMKQFEASFMTRAVLEYTECPKMT